MPETGTAHISLPVVINLGNNVTRLLRHLSSSPLPTHSGMAESGGFLEGKSRQEASLFSPGVGVEGVCLRWFRGGMSWSPRHWRCSPGANRQKCFKS